MKKVTLLTAMMVLFVTAMSYAGSVQLPRTGQSLCYSYGYVIDCTNTGQDGELRKGAEWPYPRFTDNGDGSVSDNLTGLIWTKDARTPTVGTCLGGYRTWQEALDYVACLNTSSYLGYSDWRLPNLNELESLIDAGRSSPALPIGNPFNSYCYYWSSTSNSRYSSIAWLVNIYAGMMIYADKSNSSSNSYYCNTSTSFYVWPVRSGQ